MARLLIAVSVVVGVLATTAPTAPLPDGVRTVQLYGPTKLGTRRVYLRTEPTTQLEETWEVTKVVDRDGAKLVTTEYVLADGSRKRHQTTLLSRAGVSWAADEGTAYDPPWTVLKFPYKQGESWAGRAAHGAPDDRMAVVGTETVTVPAGRFEAVVVEWQCGGPLAWSRYAFAPEVGLVRLTYPCGSLVLKSVAVPAK